MHGVVERRGVLLLQDNYEHPVQNCLEKEAFRDLVMNGTKDGFEYLEEGHGKVPQSDTMI